MRGHTFLRLVDFLRRAHVTGVENGQVKIAHTGCSHESPALLEPLARPIWLASEGVARGVSQFIGQNKVWEGDGWVWGEGKSSPPVLWKNVILPDRPTLLCPCETRAALGGSVTCITQDVIISKVEWWKEPLEG